MLHIIIRLYYCSCICGNLDMIYSAESAGITSENWTCQLRTKKPSDKRGPKLQLLFNFGESQVLCFHFLC